MLEIIVSSNLGLNIQERNKLGIRFTWSARKVGPFSSYICEAIKLILSPSTQANHIASAQGPTLTSLCILIPLSMAEQGVIGANGAYGDWKKGTDGLEIKIKDPKEVIKVTIDGSHSTAELKFNKDHLQIIIPKQVDNPASAADDDSKKAQKSNQKENKSTQDQKGNETVLENVVTPTSKSDDGSKKDERKDQEQKGNETVLENVVTMLKTYKGIVITAFIAISLGLLLRRKFKAAGH